jgi:SAM-dependent methyltransferase
LADGDDTFQFYTEYYEGSEARRTSNIDIRASQYWQAVERCPVLDFVGDSVADVGCGDGHLCARLKHWGWRNVVGFEVSRSRAARARQLYPEIQVIEELPERAGLPPESFDLMILEAVIEHLRDPVQAVANLRPLLKKGGLVALTTPNMDSGDFRILGRRWTGMIAPHVHIFLFTHDSMARLLEKAGLTLVAQTSYFVPFYRPAEYIARLASGDIKGTAWRAHQELGTLYSRVVGQGPHLVAVARRES